MCHALLQTSLVTASLVVGLSLAACQPIAVSNEAKGTAVPNTGISSPQQFIVKFKTETFTCNADDIARLATQTGLRLTHVRPLSGNACVIRQQPNVRSHAQGLKLLQQHPAVEWVELDGVMKTM